MTADPSLGCCGCNDNNPGLPAGSSACNDNPVFFKNGAIELTVTDLASPLGSPLAQSRAFANRMSADYFGPTGWNWVGPEVPSLVFSGSSIMVLFGPNKPYWFDVSGSTYTPRYAILGAQLSYDSTNHQYVFVLRAPGRTDQTIFDVSGRLVSRTDANGLTISTTYVSGLLTTLTRVVGSVTERLRYTYSYEGSGYVFANVTYSREISSVETNVLRAVYTYYASGHAYGNVGDLKTVTLQQPTSGGGWENISVRYHRYYKSGDTDGFAHGLKLHIGPEGYRLAWNNGINFETATDATLRTYSEHYFKYDPSTRAVTFEDAAICSTCPRGTTGDTFVITQRGSGGTGFNSWQTRCELTFRDGSKLTVYTNSVAQPIFKIETSADGTQEWYHFFQYDSEGRLVVEASPSAITGYNEIYDDLVNWAGSGSSTYIRASDGLLNTYDYATSNPKYLQTEMIRHGKSGTDIKLKAYTYASWPSGPTVYVPDSVTVYLDAADDTVTAVTSFTYTWHSGTNRMASRTTTLPLVPTGQNGSNSSDTIVENFDTYGNLTSRTDERGFVNTYVYDVSLGAATRQTLNYQYGVTAVGVNVVTDFAYDNLGRQIQALGPAHTAEIGGSATTVRTATWTAYKPSVKPDSVPWALDEVRTGSGYATGSSPSYTYTLLNPVSLTRNDKAGRNVDQITAAPEPPSMTATIDQADWKSWSSSQYSTRGMLLSQRVYHDIPSSGEPSEGTNYAQTTYVYDDMDRRIKTVSPGGTNDSPAGTITRVVYANRNQVKETWVGTNDTGATETNPAGSGSPNNMVKVSANVYDGGDDGGDGNLTQVTQFASASDTRVTAYGYDWRNRRTSEDGEIDVYEEYTYDNLDRVIETRRRDTSSSGSLIAKSEMKYDKLGRVYQRITYAVSAGEPGNSLTENTWYDAAGNQIKQIAAGTGIVFSKTAYNGVGWVTASYTGYNTTNDWTTANSLTNDTIVEQSENTYDEAGNVISTAGYQRLNDATDTGVLTYGSQPKARVSYSASWYDGINRAISSANYGAISSFSRPDTTPGRSDDILVTTMSYDDAGRNYSVVDPKGVETQTTFDAAGRTTQTVEDYGGLARTTQFTYTLNNQIATLTAINSTTGNQVTTYTYGTTLSESEVARNDLLRFIAYPDSTGSSDRVAIAYNRLGQERTRTDQRGTIRTFYYDKLGRLTNDCVTTPGTGTDTAILRISRTYEVRGMLVNITSYDGSDSVVNDVKLEYNSFSQLTTEYQAHGGEVNISTSPKVQYTYDSGDSSSNKIRPTSITYPNSRVIDYDYGDTGAIDDQLNRVASIVNHDPSTTLAAYTYLGAGTVVCINYAQPNVKLDLWRHTNTTFDGLDRFGRIIDQYWQYNGSPNADLDRYKYGYDRNSNRIWKQNCVGTALDEFYTYDNLNRLTVMQRGTLTGSPPTGISGTPVRELDWTLDPTGNWSAHVTHTGTTKDLDQTRTANTVNEITAIAGTPDWADPIYDAAGNTTTFPKASDPTNAFTAVYDAWNRMVEVDNGSSPVAKYQYDGNNRRIVTLTYSSGALSETRHFYFTNNWQDIEERVGTSATADQQYVWGIRYIDELLCRDRTVSGSNERLYAMQDANFNLTSICDASGAVAERYVFDPYGNRSIQDATWGQIGASAYAWEVGHQGLMQDGESRLVYNRIRYLHPPLGIFIERDPITYVDGANLYEYVKSDPLNARDPSGLTPCQCQPVGTTAFGTWTYVLSTTGALIQANPGAAGFAGWCDILAVYARKAAQLFYCCDQCDSGFFKWNSSGQQYGTASSGGGGKVPNPGLAIGKCVGNPKTVLITIPLPYGQAVSLPDLLALIGVGPGSGSYTWLGPAPNWPGRPPVPTTPGPAPTFDLGTCSGTGPRGWFGSTPSSIPFTQVGAVTCALGFARSGAGAGVAGPPAGVTPPVQPSL